MLVLVTLVFCFATMDSMRSLNTSLPVARSDGPPEQLLQAFRSAALSVTTLYKAAAAGQSTARQLGYQEALEDLLSFLDAKHLGLGDGEGWQVRQWATERLDLGNVGRSASAPAESEDEKADNERARSSSPPNQVEASGDDRADNGQQSLGSDNPVRQASSASVQSSLSDPSTSSFTFASSLPMPKTHDQEMVGSEHGIPGGNQSRRTDTSATSGSPSKTGPALRFEVVPRSSRHRHGSGGVRAGSRTVSALGGGAGHKRKLPLGEFFDLAGLGGGRDGFGGGGKRGRFGRDSSE